jgi:hypothetical protein
MSLMLLYLVMFCVVDIAAESGATAALVVCVMDLVAPAFSA